MLNIVFQMVELLRAIYRPQNFYCIHVDADADDNYKQAVHKVGITSDH